MTEYKDVTLPVKPTEAILYRVGNGWVLKTRDGNHTQNLYTENPYNTFVYKNLAELASDLLNRLEEHKSV